MKKIRLLTVICILGLTLLNNKTMAQEYTFPPLPYAYDALEPYIDAKTMEIHYDKHHRAYFNNYVTAIKGTKLESQTVNEIFTTMSKQAEAVRNNGGGLYNHSFFWNNLAKGPGKPSTALSAELN